MPSIKTSNAKCKKQNAKFSAIGSSTCVPGCKCAYSVRQVGATSHMYERHMMHAAHSAGHIWAAAIVAGLSLVLTGAVAFHSAQATSSQRAVEAELVAKQELSQEIQLLKQELQKTLELLERTSVSCESGA